jgi:hypothetical protein
MKIVALVCGLHVFAAVAHACLFAFGLYISTDLAKFAIVRYRTKLPFDPTNIDAMVMSHVNILSMLTWAELISALFECAHAVLAYLVGDFRKLNHNPIRWVEYSITATAITLALAIGSGIIEFEALLFLAITGVFLQFTGYVAERTNRVSTAVVSVCVGYAILALQIFAIRSSDQRRSWDGGWKSDEAHVDAGLHGAFDACRRDAGPGFDVWTGNIVLYAVYYSLFGVHAVMHLVARTKCITGNMCLWADFRFVDIVYTLLSLSSKLILFMIVVTSFKTYEEHYSPCVHRVTVDPMFSVEGWALVRAVMYIVPSVIAVALAVGAGALIRKEQRMLRTMFPVAPARAHRRRPTTPQMHPKCGYSKV